jgi:hypothetical protein
VIDLKLLRDDPDLVRASQRARGESTAKVDTLLAADASRREAIARFEALRRSWAEAVISDGNAMVVYFEHLDAMLAALCGENGPFCGCVGGRHNDTGISSALGQDEPDEHYYRSFEHPDDTP